MASSIVSNSDENKELFSKLYELSQYLLSILAINLSSERNFSYTGLTLNDRRSRLKPFNVNELFIRANYHLYD